MMTTSSTHNDDMALTMREAGAERKTPLVPKYQRLKQALLARVASGELAAGALIPSEPALCREFAVSRTTVRKAVGDLVHEGRLVAVQGKGTFVAAPKVEERFVQRALGIYEDMERRGIEVTTRVLRQELVPAPPEVARRLRLDADTRVHHVVRLRMVDGEPVLVSTTYIPAALCPDLVEQNLERGSLYRLLHERYGLALARGVRRLEAVAAGQREARLLEIALGSPLLLLESIAYLVDGRPLELSIALQRGDRTIVEVDFATSAHELPTGLTGWDGEQPAAGLLAASLAGGA